MKIQAEPHSATTSHYSLDGKATTREAFLPYYNLNLAKRISTHTQYSASSLVAYKMIYIIIFFTIILYKFNIIIETKFKKILIEKKTSQQTAH